MMRAFVGAHLSTRYCRRVFVCAQLLVRFCLSCVLLSGHLPECLECEVLTVKVLYKPLTFTVPLCNPLFRTVIAALTDV